MKKLKMSVLMLLAVIVVSGSIFSGCGSVQQSSEKESVKTEATKTAVAVEENSCRMYDYLTDREKDIYTAAYENVLAGKLSFDIKVNNRKGLFKSMKRALNSVYMDHPEFFWLNNMDNWLEEGETIEVNMGSYWYWADVEDKEKCIEDVNNAAEKIAKEAEKFSDEIDKVKFVHDYLVENITYLHSAVEDELNFEVPSQKSRSVYGVLIEKSAVCSGYSKAFQLIMNKLGVKCGYMEGKAENQKHAWNFLNLDGEYYWMDVTWDDTDSGEVIYTYYNVNDTVLLSNHKPKNNIFIPECTSTKYIVREGAYIESYNYEDFKDAVVKQKDEEKIIVSFSSVNDIDKLEEDLFGENMKCRELESLLGINNLSIERFDAVCKVRVTGS